MITQTLEWHRFEEKRPELETLCLVMRESGCPAVFRLINDDLEEYWVGLYETAPRPSDLWAYWSKPKEEGK